MPKPLPLIACTLGAEDQRARLEEWRSLLAQAASRADVPGGKRYVFDAELGASVQRLAAAESDCCSFLDFELSADENGVAMTVTTVPQAEPALRFVFG